MPNNIVNIITVDGSDERVTEFFDSIKGSNEVIDFNRIFKMPEGLKDAEYREWAIANWGTKWNAYKSRMVDDYTVRFETAWNGIPELIGVLSTQWPDIEFGYMFADEDYGYNTGCGLIKDGQLNMCYPDDESEEAWKIYFATHESMREQFVYKNGTYELI